MLAVKRIVIDSRRYWPKLLARNLFTVEYLDSVNLQIERRRTRGHAGAALKSKHKILKLYEKRGITGISTENLQKLIHCIEPGDPDDMSYLTDILIKDCLENFRKIESIRMIMNRYFWLCYVQKDVENAKLIFDQALRYIDSYHTKNRYFSTLLEAKKYEYIVEGYEKLENPSFDDKIFCMAAFYKLGNAAEFDKAKVLYESHSKGRVSRIFALFCLRQNEIDQAKHILNLNYCLENNIIAKERVQYNLQLMCLLKIGEIKLCMDTVKKWSEASHIRAKTLSISSEILKMLKDSIKIEDQEILNQLYENLKEYEFITENTVEEIVFEPVDWNKKVQSKGSKY